MHRYKGRMSQLRNNYNGESKYIALDCINQNLGRMEKRGGISAPTGFLWNQW